jgi:hypothetical protein
VSLALSLYRLYLYVCATSFVDGTNNFIQRQW